MSSKALSAPNLSTMDFPSLTASDGQNGPSQYGGDDIQQSVNPYRPSDKDNILSFKSSSTVPPSRGGLGGIDFASAVRKLAAQDSGVWKYDRNSSADVTIGSSRSTNVLTSTYNSGHGRGIYGDRVQSRGSSWDAPIWLETGDAVGKFLGQSINCVYLPLDVERIPLDLYTLMMLRWQQICILS